MTKKNHKIEFYHLFCRPECSSFLLSNVLQEAERLANDTQIFAEGPRVSDSNLWG
jgi:hypothetical protein